MDDEVPVFPHPCDMFKSDDPIIRASLNLWMNGKCSLEQAMMLAAMELSKDNEKLRKRVEECFIVHSDPRTGPLTP